MILNNLVGITLERISVEQVTIQRLITAAERNIADAKIEIVSNENRFDELFNYC